MIVLNKLWDFLGSRRLSVYIFITALTYFLFLIIFSGIVPPWWVDNISRLLPFKVLYAIFFINLIICEIKWLPVIMRRCRKPEKPVNKEDLQRFRHGVEVRFSDFGVPNIEKYLRRRGYKVQAEDFRQKTTDSNRQSQSSIIQPPVPGLQSVLYACCGRFSPIGNFLFHLSFLFLLAGIFASLNSHFEKNVLLMEGQVSNDGFEVLEIVPEFWEEKLLFTDLRALVRSGDAEELVRLSQPASIGGGDITIQGIGYTPKYILRNLSGRQLDVGYVNLLNFVPGSIDHFSIPGFPYKIYVSIYPDYELREGKAGTRSMNLNNPRYLVRVVRGKTQVYSGILGLKDEAFFDGLRLSFPELKYNGSFHIVRDPGMRFIWAAFILMGAGLVWKLLFYRREVAICILEDKIYLYLNSDYYPGLLLEKLTVLSETEL